MVSYAPIKEMDDLVERTRTVANVLKLRRQLDEEIPKRTEETLLLATWNIREFKDNRRKESLYYIAEILSRFDLIAVQEVSTDLKGLEKVMQLMDPSWTYIVTDSTEGDAGGSERMAFIFDRKKITFGKMAGEIVLTGDNLVLTTVQFARTPFCVSFRAKWFRFKLATVHIFYGTSKSDPGKKRRIDEIEKIAKFLTKRSKKENESYILLGDFNIEGTKDVTMQALESEGFYIPDTIKKHPTDLGQKKHYDQIAFNLKLEEHMHVFSEGEQKSGAFNFTKSVYCLEDCEEYKQYFPKEQQAKTEDKRLAYFKTYYRTYQMSDHIPLWVELKIDFSDQYLKKIKSEETPINS